MGVIKTPVPCRAGFEHAGRSCISSPFHMVFSREITSDEWKEFSSRVDATWDGERETWDAEAVLALMSDIAPDLRCVGFTP